VTFIGTDDEGVNAAIDVPYRAKYGDSGYVTAMITEPTRSDHDQAGAALSEKAAASCARLLSDRRRRRGRLTRAPDMMAFRLVWSLGLGRDARLGERGAKLVGLVAGDRVEVQR
jgi:hypothetical protein